MGGEKNVIDCVAIEHDMTWYEVNYAGSTMDLAFRSAANSDEDAI
jgi:hypothetical protein